MVQTLFELASLNARNAVVDDGRVFDVSNLSTSLRCWIFKLFRMKRSLDSQNVNRLFCQPGFFDEFTTISIEEPGIYELDNDEATCFGSFIPCLVTIFSLNPHLAGNIRDLRLVIRVDCGQNCKGKESAKKCPLMEDLSTLLFLCKNLKRLRIIPRGSAQSNVKCHEFSNPPVSPSCLEHLSLVSYCDISMCLRWFPKPWFESISSLELLGFRYLEKAYLDMLTYCKDTLTSLSVSDSIDYDRKDAYASPIPIVLPQLDCLSLRLHYCYVKVFESILEHCPKLTRASVNMNVEDISETELAALAKLSERLQGGLDLSLYGRSRKVCEVVKVVGERVIEVTCSEYQARLWCDIAFRFCTNLRSFMDRRCDLNTAIFLEKLFSDKERAAKFSKLQLLGHFPKSMLNALFSNCCKLEYLYLEIDVGNRDINDLLKTWIDNGARPTSVLLCKFDRVCPEIVSSLLKTCGRDLSEIYINVKELHEKIRDDMQNIIINYCPYVTYYSLFDHTEDIKPSSHTSASELAKRLFFKRRHLQ